MLSRVRKWLKKWWYLLVAGLSVVVAVVLRRRPVKPVADPRQTARASKIVQDAIDKERAAGEAARAKAREAADQAHDAEQRGHAEGDAIKQLSSREREEAVRRIKERLRKRGTTLLILVACAGIPRIVSAAEPVTHATHDDGHSLAAGWWMDDAEHAETAAWLAELDGLRTASDKWQVAAEQYEQAALRDATSVVLCTSIQEATERDLRVADSQLAKARATLDKWYHRPGLMLGLGVATGFVATVAVAWGMR